LVGRVGEVGECGERTGEKSLVDDISATPKTRPEASKEKKTAVLFRTGRLGEELGITRRGD